LLLALRFGEKQKKKRESGSVVILPATLSVLPKRVHHTHRQCTENCEFCSQFDLITPQWQGRNCNCNLAHSHFRHFNSF
jgi:hypothetical protein